MPPGFSGRLPRPGVVSVSIAAMVMLVVAAWVFVLETDRSQGAGLLSLESVRRGWDFLAHDLLGVDASRTPAFARWSEWKATAPLAYRTMAMSVLAIGIAGLVALATFMFGARNIMMGELAPYGSRVGAAVFVVVRAFFTLTRSIPELLWALIIIFMFSPGILPGALALGVHNAGVLGKLSSEVVEGLDRRPLRALRSAGAGRLQVLAYGVLPQALPRLLTYLFYRWELIVRTTIVVGFVAAGGLGFEFSLAMAHLKYTTVTLLLMWYLLLVVAVDLMAAVFRRLAK
ncbi:MAG: ABC transporter permease subunit [Dehalococcoidia bacterium]